jgi:hypothetical protein
VDDDVDLGGERLTTYRPRDSAPRSEGASLHDGAYVQVVVHPHVHADDYDYVMQPAPGRVQLTPP